MFHIVVHYVLYKFSVCVYMCVCMYVHIYVCVYIYMIVLIQICFINGEWSHWKQSTEEKRMYQVFCHPHTIPLTPCPCSESYHLSATYLIICLHFKYIITYYSWFCFYPVIICLYKTYLFVKFKICQDLSTFFPCRIKY